MNHYKRAIEWGKKNGLRFMLAIPDAPGILCTRYGAPDEKIVVALKGDGIVGEDVNAIWEWAARWYNSLGWGINHSAKGAVLEFKPDGNATLTEAKTFKTKDIGWTAKDFAID